MAGIKSLAKDTAIYGLSSIIGRFLNWCLVPIYTIMFPANEYGVVTVVYSAVALLLIILTYGLETGFFRFANHEKWKDPMEVYSTCLISLIFSSLAFIALVFVFLKPASALLCCENHPSFTAMMAVCVAIDAFSALPFSYLRFKKRPMRFAALRLTNIAINIGLNLFFILLCPVLWKSAPWTISWFYNPDFGIGWIFTANLIASIVTLLLLYPELHGFKYRFNPRLWKEMIRYSLPLLVLGVAGIMNQTIDKLIYPYLVTDPAQAMHDVGIYGANYKIAIIMVMFTQAFRFAYEPFIFAQNKEKGADKMNAYRDAMKYFVIFSMVIFLGVMFYIDILKYFISPRYFSGLKVVPIIMVAEVCFGIFFNLSIWYKLTDHTVWGMYFSLIGLAITLALNILLVPHFGYMGCAWAALSCYSVMMITSYFVGQKKYPIDYDVKKCCAYVAFAAVLYIIGIFAVTPWAIVNYVIRTTLLAIYVITVIKREHVDLSPITKLIKR
jgi:O-antigen/teichoic acid export membrane protein